MVAPENFVSEENEKTSFALSPLPFVKYSCNASIVALSFSCAATTSAIVAAVCVSSNPSRIFVSYTCIPGSVIVPVLSTHNTLTRASVSMHFISWIKTFFCARRTEDTAIATLESKYNPSGIIPMIAATIPVILSFNVPSLKI